MPKLVDLSGKRYGKFTVLSRDKEKHGKSHSRLYEIWHGMKRRCYGISSKDFTNYGFRGIIICPEWLHDFQAFYDWAMSHGYSDELTIDRIDNDKGVFP